MGAKYIRKNRDGTESIITPGKGEFRGKRNGNGMWKQGKQINYQARFNTFMLVVVILIIIGLGYAASLGLF